MNCELEEILTTRDLAVGYRDGKRVKRLLENVNLGLRSGRLTALLGRNGAGKSTLLRALSRGDKPIDGTIMLRGIDIGTLSNDEWSRLVAIVTTDRIAAGALTVTELVALGRQPYTGLLGRLDADDRDIVADAIAAGGLNDKASRYIATLSDGERQKAMVARALAQQTPIIMLDEPTAFLDVASRIDILRLLRHVTDDLGRTILLSTHDISQTLTVTDDLWVIDRMGNVHSGKSTDLISNGTLNNVFPVGSVRFNPEHMDYEAIK